MSLIILVPSQFPFFPHTCLFSKMQSRQDIKYTENILKKKIKKWKFCQWFGHCNRPTVVEWNIQSEIQRTKYYKYHNQQITGKQQCQ